MKTAFRITDEGTFHSNVVEVDVEGLNSTIYNSQGVLHSFGGTIGIEVVGRGWIYIAGEHGLCDYCDEFGFELIK